MCDLDAYMTAKQRRVNDALDRVLEGEDTHTLAAAMRYSVEAGGKRLRPILCLAATELVGGHEEDALPVACALELIHTYSLVHDDLPAMDDDDVRRGKPTCHKAFDEATAILAGDALLTAAFEVLGTLTAFPAVSLRVISVIATAAGRFGMVQGQMLDLFHEGKAVTWETLSTLHGLKTGALIEASVVSGAVMGGGTEEQIAAVSAYGRHIGLAFQIADDILNESGDPEVLGKPVGSDRLQQKATALSTLGLAGARQRASGLLADALKALVPFGEKADLLCCLARYVVERTY